MNCIICGAQVINIDNSLQKKVTKFQQSNQGMLDLKHEWIKSWKICLTCSGKYSNEELIATEEYLNENDNHKIAANRVANRIITTKHKKQKEKRKIALQIYIDNKINEIMHHSNGGGYKKKIINGKYDDNYISYVKDGESVAVLFIRDCVNQIKTSGMWIDILSLDTYENYGRLEFNYIIAELFPRKRKPVYPAYTRKEEIAYITWKTAVEDIAEQRQKVVRGPKYLILSHLYNENKGKYIKKVIYWDLQNNRYTVDIQTGERVEIKLPKIPSWKYDIRYVQKVTDKKIKYIDKHKDQIIDQIIENKQSDIRWFIPESAKSIL